MTRMVRVSAANARLLFAGCSVEFISRVCGAACCDAPSRPTGMLVTIHASEEAAIRARGGRVAGGLLQPAPGTRGCSFKHPTTKLCGLHLTPDKPFGCIASPFTLNRSGTLIVRNRYKLLPCYRAGAAQPAYRAFAASLALLFGPELAAKLAAHFDAGGSDIALPMADEVAARLVDNDETKKRATGAKGDP